ncbi:hypothetical protein [Curtobacterium sp. MCJR17_043]|uniref:hypothetical protein n=1 Tax=Curtobacterium sp. MCJR17_043 TaxID=2175660 RepID=UPI0024DFB4EF|nr:hypothetical protein [Curtobacterium sp. MCJR17_043]WIB34836.1 hypothetical protein DEJ15_09665 [Curtobacterium sp. MCJR17_043]
MPCGSGLVAGDRRERAVRGGEFRGGRAPEDGGPEERVPEVQGGQVRPEESADLERPEVGQPEVHGPRRRHDVLEHGIVGGRREDQQCPAAGRDGGELVEERLLEPTGGREPGGEGGPGGAGGGERGRELAEGQRVAAGLGEDAPTRGLGQSAGALGEEGLRGVLRQGGRARGGPRSRGGYRWVRARCVRSR